VVAKEIPITSRSEIGTDYFTSILSMLCNFILGTTSDHGMLPLLLPTA
jgi:hypothetical protein